MARQGTWIRWEELAEGDVLAQTGEDAGSWYHFTSPLRIWVAHRVEEVVDVLTAADSALAAGEWVAGWVAYEAASGIDSALSTSPPGDALPLVWLGTYSGPRRVSLDLGESPPPTGNWEPGLSEGEFVDRVRRIKALIAAGDTYQVNLTFPMRSLIPDPVWPAVAGLFRAQPPRAGAVVCTGRHVVASASPELFLERGRDGGLVSHPMKGTRRRPWCPADTEAAVRDLAASVKDRAENVMIVDMIRNDLGRVAVPGSVEVDRLFDVERYPTVLQMTSTVRARSRAGLRDLFTAAFPCASITGAPKRRTMDIIRGLEGRPRGVYTGAMGWAGPDGRLRFNVAIRTLVSDRETGVASYGVGAGIVWDSDPAMEYLECLDKAAAAVLGWPAFRLLETLAWRAGRGFDLLEEHLARLAQTAEVFQYSADLCEIRNRLDHAPKSLHGDTRVRFLLDRTGRIEVQTFPLDPLVRPWRVAVDSRPTSTRSLFVAHKTTWRKVYEEALARHPGVDDVILWNLEGDLTESTRANLVIEDAQGCRITPPLASGLLPGVRREAWLREGRMVEGRIRREDLLRARRVFLLNSLRGEIPVEFVEQGPDYPE